MPTAILTAAMLAASTTGAHAQDPTCDIPPVSIPLFDATPADVIAATPAVTGDVPQVTEEDVEIAANRIVACANSASQAERYAVFTDRILASTFAGESSLDQPAFERMIATGTVSSAGAFTLESLNDIEVRDDGTIAVTLVIDTPEQIVSDRVLLVWSEEKGAWLIDAVLQMEATPTS